MGERTNVRYTPLPTDDTQQQQNQRRRSFSTPGNRYGGRGDDADDGNYDMRFDYMPKQKIPWKSIALALFLLGFGSTLLIISHLIFTGHMGGEKSQALGFLTIGFLMFLPVQGACWWKLQSEHLHFCVNPWHTPRSRGMEGYRGAIPFEHIKFDSIVTCIKGVNGFFY